METNFMYEYNNDIAILQNNITIATNTLEKLEKGDLTTESANDIISSLNNFETTEIFTVESGAVDKKSIITRIKDFIIKLIRMVAKVFYALYKKLRDIFLRLSKRAYDIKSEINRGHFVYTNDIGKTVLDYIAPFYEISISTAHNFNLFYNNFSKAFETTNIMISSDGIITITEDFKKKISSKVNKFFEDFGILNPYINKLRKRSYFAEVILVNPKNKTYTLCDYKQDTGYTLIVKDMFKGGDNYTMDEYEKFMDISLFGSLLTTIEKLTGEFDKAEKSVNGFLESMPSTIEKLAKQDIEKYNPSGDSVDFVSAFDKNMVETTNQVTEILKTTITNNIVDHAVYIDGLLKIIENIIKTNTTNNN